MNTVENDGAAFDKACSLCHNDITGEAPPAARGPASLRGPRSPLSGPGLPGPEERLFCCQVQVVPLTENDVGEASLLVQVPWKPSEVEPPAAMLAL